MWFAAVLGFLVGCLINICAGRLPKGAETRPNRRYHAVRWTVVGLLAASLCAHLQRQHGWSLTFAAQFTYCSLLLCIAVIDLEHGLVPNALVGPGMALALCLSAFSPAVGPGAALAGAAVGGGIFMLLALVRRGALGYGDVKLAALIGMMTGFPAVLQALILGIVLGGLAAAVLLLTKLRQPKEYMPYAPFLAGGGMATLLYGQHIATWYAGLIGRGG